jgi:hypothetical protein
MKKAALLLLVLVALPSVAQTIFNGAAIAKV